MDLVHIYRLLWDGHCSVMYIESIIRLCRCNSRPNYGSSDFIRPTVCLSVSRAPKFTTRNSKKCARTYV